MPSRLACQRGFASSLTADIVREIREERLVEQPGIFRRAARPALVAVFASGMRQLATRYVGPIKRIIGASSVVSYGTSTACWMASTS